MKPFKMFFGLAIAVMLFSFMAKIVFVAFIAASIMSIVYAIYRRVKDFITYDSYGEQYSKGYHRSRTNRHWDTAVDPIFQQTISREFSTKHAPNFVKIV